MAKKVVGHVSFESTPPKIEEFRESDMKPKTVDERTQIYMDKYGMKWRSAREFAEELAFLESWHEYDNPDRLIDMMMNIAYKQGYQDGQYDMT